MEKMQEELQEELQAVETAWKETTRDETAEVMAELLMDDSVSTYKMFEELSSCYMNATQEERNGIDAACAILTGYRLGSIAKLILERKEES